VPTCGSNEPTDGVRPGPSLGQMAPEEHHASWLIADTHHLELLDTIDEDRGEGLTLPYFSGPQTLAGYVGYRLSEQALHGWDVEVALEPTAVVGRRELDVLWERTDIIATRFHDSNTLSRLAPFRTALPPPGPPARPTRSRRSRLGERRVARTLTQPSGPCSTTRHRDLGGAAA
jgi:hypothetical protein